MKNSGFALAVSLAVGGCVSTEEVDLDNGEISAKDMPAYCSQKAAAAFGVEPREVALSPIDTAGGIHTLYGQYPPKGDEAKTFQCQFDPNGVFISVIPTVRRG